MKNKLYKAAGDRLQTIMRSKGFSAKELAKASGVSRSSIYYYAAGDHAPLTVRAIAICTALECKVSDIWPDDLIIGAMCIHPEKTAVDFLLEKEGYELDSENSDEENIWYSKEEPGDEQHENYIVSINFEKFLDGWGVTMVDYYEKPDLEIPHIATLYELQLVAMKMAELAK